MEDIICVSSGSDTDSDLEVIRSYNEDKEDRVPFIRSTEWLPVTPVSLARPTICSLLESILSCLILPAWALIDFYAEQYLLHMQIGDLFRACVNLHCFQLHVLLTSLSIYFNRLSEHNLQVQNKIKLSFILCM